ncbi:MAG: CBS domain-containing protein [Caldisericia bacterium]|nr:CBS domain-containing protein [Caldisericia bacterium]
MKKLKKISPKALCISHSYSDFDAIASTIAASKLYPDAVPVLNSSVEDEVQKFLAIYRDFFSFVPIQDISFENVELVILTDTQNTEKMKPLQKELQARKIKVVCFDHHPLEENPYIDKLHLKHYGAVMTLMYERLKRKRISFNAIEATLFIIGIYEDTGSLTFPSTTPKDLEAAAFFLRNGAKLNVISEFIFPPLGERQKKLFSILLESTAVYSIKGVQIAISGACYPHYVNGVSFLAHRLLDSIDVDVLFVVVKRKKKTIIVARSEDDHIIHVGNIMEQLGGGGHPQAGSAFIEEDDRSLNEWSLHLLKLAKKKCQVSKLVRDYMSSPVKTIEDSAVAEEALRIMLRYGHTGLPVVNENKKITGIISRKDIERISDEKLLRRPVKSYMTKHVIVVSPETSLKEAEKLSVDKDIGRLPVVFDQNIVGILTRSDLLRALYGISKTTTPPFKHYISVPNRMQMNQWFESYFPKQHLKIIRQIGKIADSIHQRAFLVGGCVRDLLLEYSCKDYDFLVEGDAIKLADLLQPIFSCKLIKNPSFHTVKLLLPDTEMDLASTRTEYYEYPAALPTVTSGSLREDLLRRDFSINCLAISLEPKRFGTLLDYYHGYDDLRHKKIRILHNLSFIEDPSRIFRAIVYAIRYDFSIEEQTKEFAIQAMKSGLFKNTTRFRILSSFINLLTEPISIVKTFQLMKELDALQVISDQFVFGDLQRFALNRSKNVLQKYYIGPKWILYIAVMTISLPLESTLDICERLRMSHKDIAMIQKVHRSYPSLNNELLSIKQNSHLYQTLKPFSSNELGVFLCLSSIHVRKKILHYVCKLQKISLEITANEIKALTGLEKRDLGNCIEELKMLKLDGFIPSKEDEIQTVIIRYAQK